MATKVRVNLASEQELLELPGLGPAQAAAIVSSPEHGPIRTRPSATILRGFRLAELARGSDFSPRSTAPEARA